MKGVHSDKIAAQKAWRGIEEYNCRDSGACGLSEPSRSESKVVRVRKVVSGTLEVCGAKATAEVGLTHSSVEAGGNAEYVSAPAVSPAPNKVLDIPAKLGGKPVIGIGAGAFNGFSAMTGVRIPKTVWYIDAGAFAGCSNLASIQVDKANEYYSVVNGLLIYDRQVRQLRSLKKDGVKDVDATQKNLNKAISECSCDIYLAKVPPAAKSVKIPPNVTSILPKAFSGCRNLTTVTLPPKLKRIGYAAFSGCAKLKEITIPETVDELVWDEGDGSPYLRDYKLEDDYGLRFLRGLFSGCDSLTSVKISRKCQEYWMEDDLLLAKGGRAWSAGKDRVALVKCLASGNVRIPASVKIISDGAFAGCTGITSFEVDKANTEFSFKNGSLLSKNGAVLFKCADNQAEIAE